MYAFLKKHWVLIAVLVLLFGIFGTGIFYIKHSAALELTRQRHKSTKELATIDQAITRIQIKKAAELKAKQEAEAKAAAAAKRKAEQEAAAKAPTTGGVVDTNYGAHNDPSKIDVIINKKHPTRPQDYIPNVIVTACGSQGSATISVLARNDFIALCNAAYAAGVPLSSSSSYRSYTTQVSTYNYWVSISGTAGADRYSARPGYSEHQTGLSIDFSVPGSSTLDSFCGTKQQKWLATHARTYGWVQRYTVANSLQTGYNAECWHYRYIGKANASAYLASGSLSLESFWGVSGGLY